MIFEPPNAGHLRAIQSTAAYLHPGRSLPADRSGDGPSSTRQIGRFSLVASGGPGSLIFGHAMRRRSKCHGNDQIEFHVTAPEIPERPGVQLDSNDGAD